MRLYQGWINLAVAALAMSATLPGRTNGLGLITKAVTTDPTLGVNLDEFTFLNVWSVIFGSILCWPVGRAIDRWGVRLVGSVVAVGLGVSVLAMSVARSELALFMTLILVRGFGQGALSVVSLAMIGKWFTRRLPTAMGVFTVLMAIGFGVGIFTVGESVAHGDWRMRWAALGVFMFVVLLPLTAWLVRDTPESVGLAAEKSADAANMPVPAGGTLADALRSPGFWAFTLATSFFNLVWSAISFLNQPLVESIGFGGSDAVLVMTVLGVGGVLANLIGGWLAMHWSMGRVLLIGMVAMAIGLEIFPFLDNTMYAGLMTYATFMGIAGGIVTLVFFAFYGRVFGRTHLGAIQGAAQIVSVVFSAVGPELMQRSLGWCELLDWKRSYAPYFHVAAILSLVLGLWAWVVPLSSPSSQVPSSSSTT